MISRQLICQNTAETSAKLSKILKKIRRSLEEISCLDVDAALISRLIFRMKKVFRRDKLLQSMQKINRCLTSLLEVNLPSTIKELDDCTHENNGPTKEMLQWAMLSLQRYAALLHILIARCTTAVPNLNDKLSSGHHWNIASIVLGVLGRLWVLSCHVRKKSCLWYKQLGRFIPRAHEMEDNYLISSHNFPQDLATWLENLFPPTQQPANSCSSALTESKEAAVKSDDAVEVQNEETKSAMFFNEDLGEVISRESLNDSKKPKQKLMKQIKPFTSSADLLKFIESEKSLRKKDLTAAKTKHLKNKTWNRLYESLTDLLRFTDKKIHLA
uniref:DUF4477 domain-containing protein n=1 Tax=Rhodnius prolixus TaxID=13249 RepID=T1I528_RHOPR